MDDPKESGAQRAARIRRNLAKLKAAVSSGNATDSDVQEYLESERDTPNAGAEPQGTGDKIRGGVQKLLSGASFGVSDEIGGTMRAIVPQEGQEGMGFSDRARENARAARGVGDDFAREYPKTATGLEIGGAMLMPVGAAAGAATKTGRILNASKAGATQGAAGGFLNSEIDPDEGVGGNLIAAAANTAKSAGLGALTGVAGGGAVEVGGAIVRGGRRGVTALANRAANVADDVATRIEARRLPPGSPPPGGGGRAPGGGMPSRLRRLAAGQREAEAERAVATGKRIVANRFQAEPEGFAGARAMVDELEATGRGDDALLLNAGGSQVTRLARGTRSAAKSRGSGVLDDALAEQGSRVAPRVEADISDVSGLPREEGRVALGKMQAQLSDDVEKVYANFRARGNLVSRDERIADAAKELAPPALGSGFEPTAIASAPTPAKRATPLTVWLGDPKTSQLFRRYVDAVKRLSPTLRKLPETDARVVDDAFHLLQRDLRNLEDVPKYAIDHRLLSDLRDRVLTKIEDVDPDYAAVTRSYKMDPDIGKAVQGAYEKGMALTTRPAGEVRATMDAFTPAERSAGFRGAVTGLQDRARSAAANPDLGELATFRDVWRGLAGKAEDRERLRALLGDKEYASLVRRAKAEMRMVGQNATVRGNSSTADKLQDLSELSDDAIGDVLDSIIKAGGSGSEGLRRLFMERTSNAIARFRTGVTGKTAGDVADILTTRGSGNIRSMLDELEEIAKQAERGGRRTQRPITATARVVGSDR